MWQKLHFTDSPLNDHLKDFQWSLKDYHLGEGPVSPNFQFKLCINSFFFIDSALSITDIAELASFNDYSLGEEPVSPTGQLK